MSTEKKSFIVYTEWYESIKELNLEQRGLLFTNMFYYHSKDQTKINLNNLLVKLVFKLIEPHFERNISAYDKRCETSKENGKKGGRPKYNSESPKPKNNLNIPKKPLNDNVNDNVNNNYNKEGDLKKEKIFTPPTLPEIESYFFLKCDKKNNARKEAEKYFLWYTANGWTIKGTPMNDWQKSIELWIIREKDYQLKRDEKTANNKENIKELENSGLKVRE